MNGTDGSKSVLVTMDAFGQLSIEGNCPPQVTLSLLRTASDQMLIELAAARAKGDDEPSRILRLV